MATKASNVVLNFKMDGQVKYAETLKQINSVMNTAAKEYKNHIAAMGNDASATEKLSAEKKKLEIQMEGAQKRTKMLRGEYEAMAKDTNTTTDQLTKMYGKVLDAERAETSLQKSMDRVNDGLSDQAKEARDAMDKLSALKGEAKSLDAEQKKLTSSFKLQNAELGETATESEKTALAQKQLDAQMALTERAVNNLEKQLEQAKSAYGENTVEVMQLETKLNDAKTTIKKFADSFDGIEKGSDSAAEGMENLGKKIDANTLMEGAEALQAISDKLIEIGKASFDSALEIGDSQASLQATFGLTEEEAESLNGVVQEVFKNGVAGSAGEATEAVIATKTAFADLNNADLSNLTNQVVTLSKRTGTDVTENVIAAEKLMMEFGLNSEEALNLIAAGYQNNLNKSGDFTDTINEYAPLFADAEFSAEQMLDVMKSGLDGGAENADKAADAIKEMQIRFGDGTFESNLESFSAGTADLFQKWKDGEASMPEVMESIKQDIQKMDTNDQLNALTLLGTQFEDLGIRGSTSLLGIGSELEGVNGSLDEMSQKTPSEELQSSLRELQEQLIPVGQKLVEIAQDVLPGVIEMVGNLADWFNNLSGPVQTFLTAFGGISAIFVILSPVIAAVVAGFIAFGSTMGVVIGVVAAVAAAIAGVITVIQSWGDITKRTGELTGQLVQGAKDKFSDLRTSASRIWSGIKTDISNAIEGAKNAVSSAIDKIKNLFNFEFKWPHIPLPRFSVNPPGWGIGDLLKGSIPSLDVTWNAKGGIFTQPTIFGASMAAYKGQAKLVQKRCYHLTIRL